MSCLLFTSPVIKEGPLKCYDKQKKTWKNCFGRLRQCGWFHWFDKEKSCRPINGVDLKVVSAYFAFGELLWNLPQKPLEATDCDLLRMFAIPLEPKWDSDFMFFQCGNDADMCSWITSIFNLLGEPAPDRYKVAHPSMAYPPLPEDIKLFSRCGVPTVMNEAQQTMAPMPPPRRIPSPVVPFAPPLSRRQSAVIAPSATPTPAPQDDTPGGRSMPQPTILCRIIPPAEAAGGAGQPVALLAYPILATPVLLPASAPQFLQNTEKREDKSMKSKEGKENNGTSRSPVPRNGQTEQPTDNTILEKQPSPRPRS